MRRFIVKQALFKTLKTRASFQEIMKFTFDDKGDFYKKVLKKAEDVLYGEKRKNTTRLIEGKYVIWEATKKDDGQALIDHKKNTAKLEKKQKQLDKAERAK